MRRADPQASGIQEDQSGHVPRHRVSSGCPPGPGVVCRIVRGGCAGQGRRHARPCNSPHARDLDGCPGCGKPGQRCGWPACQEWVSGSGRVRSRRRSGGPRCCRTGRHPHRRASYSRTSVPDRQSHQDVHRGRNPPTGPPRTVDPGHSGAPMAAVHAGKRDCPAVARPHTWPPRPNERTRLLAAVSERQPLVHPSAKGHRCQRADLPIGQQLFEHELPRARAAHREDHRAQRGHRDPAEDLRAAPAEGHDVPHDRPVPPWAASAWLRPAQARLHRLQPFLRLDCRGHRVHCGRPCPVLSRAANVRTGPTRSVVDRPSLPQWAGPGHVYKRQAKTGRWCSQATSTTSSRTSCTAVPCRSSTSPPR